MTAFCPGPVTTEFQEVAGLSARLRTGPGVLSAQAAARAAVSAADRGRDIAIPGPLQQAAAIAVQLFPRALVRRASRQLLRPRTEENAPAPPWSR